MKRQFPDESGSESNSPDFDESEFAELIQSAKGESPDSTLERKVLASVAYRQALAKPASNVRARHAYAIWAGVGAAVAMAAGAAVYVRGHSHTNVKITPEPAQIAGPATSPVPSPITQAPVDPCSTKRSASGEAPLIDDFEDGDDSVLLSEGRAGLWRWVRDTDAPGTSPALLPIPRPAGRANNRLALHVKGGKLLDWGAVVEFDFAPPCYDASVYRGLTFQAKGPGRIFVAPREVGIIPVALGGTCREDCHNSHVKKIDLDSQWRTYEVLWSDVAQRGYNKPALNPGRLNSLAFQIHPEDTPYDIWLDDVKFLSKP